MLIKNRKILLILLSLMLVFPAFAQGTGYDPEEPPPKEVFAKARVLAVSEIFDKGEPDTPSFTTRGQNVTLKILNGELKGRVVTIWNPISAQMGWEIYPKRGDKFLLYVDQDEKTEEGLPKLYIADYVRDSTLVWLVIFFGAALIALGRMKGFRSLLALVFTIAVILLVVIPLTLKGFNPILVAILISAIVSLVTFLLISGVTQKSLCAFVGTVGGVIAAGVIAIVVGKMIHLTGLSSEEAKMLMYSLPANVSFQGILFGSMIIGALGAVMDVAMSVSSSIEEVKKVHKEASPEDLMKAGMNVGSDVMGTMANTLILAYTGGALPLILLILVSNASMVKVFNLDMIATEIVRALAGSLGLILCVPITAITAGFLFSLKSDN